MEVKPAKRRGIRRKVPSGSIRGVLRKHGWKKALDLVKDMTLNFVEQDLQLVLSVAAKAAKWQEALRFARRINSDQGASEAANSWGKGDGWQRAIQVIQTVQWMGFEVAVETLNAASSCERRGVRRSWLLSMQCFRQISAKGLRASPVSMNSLLASLGSALRWHRGCQLLHEGLRRSIAPDDISLNSLVTACEKTAKWELAIGISLLQGMFSLEPDIIGRNAAISSCANAGQWRLASVLLSSSRQLGIRMSLVSIAAMATAGERANQWRVPLELIDSHRTLTGAVLYGAAFDALESWGKWTEALDLYQELPIQLSSPHPSWQERRPWLDPMTVFATVSACSKAEKWRQSVSLLNHVWQQSPDGQGLSTAALNACIYASAGHIGLEVLLRWMKGMHVNPDMLSYSALERRSAASGPEVVRLLGTVRSWAASLWPENRLSDCICCCEGIAFHNQLA